MTRTLKRHWVPLVFVVVLAVSGVLIARLHKVFASADLKASSSAMSAFCFHKICSGLRMDLYKWLASVNTPSWDPASFKTLSASLLSFI